MCKLKVYPLQNINFKQRFFSQLTSTLSYDFLKCEHFNKYNNPLFSICNKTQTSNDSAIENDSQQPEEELPTSISDIDYEATILMVDDEEICLYGMEIMLMGTPYSIVTLNKSTEAIEYIYNNLDNIDLIFLDLNMPEMNGLELLEKIRNDRMLASIPVILQSACTDETKINKAYILGISGFLKKPYKKSQVLHAIKEALNEK